MNTLLELSPRMAGARTIEPSVAFDETVQALTAANMCGETCGCDNAGSYGCARTGTGTTWPVA
ncbi:hypothetical protein [Streptomyces sp. NPDC048172]|uniref:hypothetical protein n=1 Tax=Streptomyces sp. NPDC048172 TaxID=3365505 RepID=UPI00371B2F25